MYCSIWKFVFSAPKWVFASNIFVTSSCFRASTSRPPDILRFNRATKNLLNKVKKRSNTNYRYKNPVHTLNPLWERFGVLFTSRKFNSLKWTGGTIDEETRGRGSRQIVWSFRSETYFTGTKSPSTWERQPNHINRSVNAIYLRKNVDNNTKLKFRLLSKRP